MNGFYDTSLIPSVRDGWLANEIWQATRYAAVENIFRIVDQEILNSLPPIIIFTPSLDQSSRIYNKELTGKPLIYLAPTLEFDAQGDVDFTFAHEIAHIFLRHHIADNVETVSSPPGVEYSECPMETSADALAESWGFRRRRRGKTGFQRIISRRTNYRNLVAFRSRTR
jgi:hypothetical protein